MLHTHTHMLFQRTKITLLNKQKKQRANGVPDTPFSATASVYNDAKTR